MRRLIQHLLRFAQGLLKAKASRGLIYIYEPDEDGIVRTPSITFPDYRGGGGTMLRASWWLDRGKAMNMSAEEYWYARLQEGHTIKRVTGSWNFGSSHCLKTPRASSRSLNVAESSGSPILVSVKSFPQFLHVICNFMGVFMRIYLLLNVLPQSSRYGAVQTN